MSTVDVRYCVVIIILVNLGRSKAIAVEAVNIDSEVNIAINITMKF